MANISKLKAVIFDMDGVLIDSEPVHYRANVNLFEKLDIEITWDYYKQFIGTTCTYMWNKMIADLNITLSPEELNNRSNDEIAKIIKQDGYPKVSGIKELLQNLKEARVRLAVASSSTLCRIEEITEAMNIRQYFDRLVSGEEVEHSKPKPDIFLKAAKDLCVEPKDCLVIEDSEHGVSAAKAAGMVCLGYINPGSGEQDLRQADCLTESFAEVDYYFLCQIKK